MEQQKLPNAQTVLTLGIISLVGTCCCSGLVGIICGLIALNYYKKDNQLYLANPNIYATDYNNLKTGRILAIIGIVLGALQILYTIYLYSTGGFEAYQQMIEQLSRQQ